MAALKPETVSSHMVLNRNIEGVHIKFFSTQEKQINMAFYVNLTF